MEKRRVKLTLGQRPLVFRWLDYYKILVLVELTWMGRVSMWVMGLSDQLFEEDVTQDANSFRDDLVVNRQSDCF